MRRSQKLAAVIACAALVFVLGFLSGAHGAHSPTFILADDSSAPSKVDLAPVWKAWYLLEDKFVPTKTSISTSAQDRVWGLIKGLAASYGDPYTTFMPPDEAKDFDEDISGSFGGVGFEMGIRDNVLTVIAPLKGTPAERAGVLAGDRILKIDGRSTHDMNIDEAVRAIRGEVGSTVELTLAREGVSDYIVLPVTRDTIDIPTLDTKLRDDQVFVISLYNFGATANSQFRSAMREYLASGARGLVIDVRGNPGGYLEGAVDIASWFLPVGKVIVSEEYGDGSKPTVHRSKGYDVVPDDQRIAVLVDGGSASASEILAGALSESGRAKLIGERTFGKGSVQEVVPLTPDTSLKITVARWLTPNGRSLSDAGLDPDLVVVPPKDEESADADVQLDAAAQYVLTGILATSTASTMERT